MSDRWAIVLALAVAAGAHLSGGPPPLVGALGIVLAVCSRRPWLLCLAAAVLAAGLAQRATSATTVTAGPFDGWATVVSDPERSGGGGIRLDLRIDGHRVEARAHGAPAAALSDRLAGERVLVTGRLRAPPDDAPWLAARGVTGRFDVERSEAWAPGSRVSQLANALRRTLAEGAATLPDDRAALLTGVVLGDDRAQSPALADDFKASGLTHLLAVSGQNVAFVLALAGPVLRRLTWRGRLPAALAVIGFFALLTRFEPSVLRASTMAGLATVAGAIGRPASRIRLLALAVAGLLLVDPRLVDSVGFALSVGASAGILLFAPTLEARLPGPRLLAAPLSVTLAAQVGVMPVLLPAFG
ncbi:MAG: ComEC/Rec2 family competence protein, partial [Acidimicrobiales bacterium]